MEEKFRKALQQSPGSFLDLVETHQSRSDRSALRNFIWSITKTERHPSPFSSTFWDALSVQTARILFAFESPNSNPEYDANGDNANTPTPIKKRRRRTARKSADERAQDSTELLKMKNLKKIGAYAYLVQCLLTNPNRAINPTDLFPTVQAFHDQLVLFEKDKSLQECVASICEQWWRDALPGRESLIAQSLPFLLSKSLLLGRKVDIHRVHNIREAFTYLDFLDESIEDLKHLLIRCLVTPPYLRIEEGKRFLSFLFGLNTQLVKQLIAIIRCQIPFGRNSILEAYGEILYKAWRAAKGPSLYEIENNCLQGFVEGAILASSRTLASSIRKVLAAFINQRTQDGVEAFLYRLQEPILFRSLQAANSNVRRNALLLFIDMFPLENPDATKEEKESLLERQFWLLDKLLADGCPDVRSVAVEGTCRILRLFWEIVPCHVAAKILSKIVDDMAKDISSSVVRCAVVNGIIYLLDNPLTHDMLKLLLPKLGHLFDDSATSVRIAIADLLLTLKDIREIQFYKVVELDLVLRSLELDQLVVAERLTRLLMPTYFPSKVPISEACTRFLSLVKRSPHGAARFCECSLLAGASHKSLLELLKFLSSLPMAAADIIDNKDKEGVLIAIARLCRVLVGNQSCRALLREVFTDERFKRMLSFVHSSTSQTALFEIASIFPAEDVPEIIKHCEEIIMDFKAVVDKRVKIEDVRAAYKLVTAYEGFDGFIKTLSKIMHDACTTAASGNENEDKRGKQERTHKTSKRKKRSSGISLKWNLKGAQCVKSDKESMEESFANALVAAWHVENLLGEHSTRKLLISSSYLESLLSGLKSIAQMTFHHSNPTFAELMLSPSQAYLSLMTFIEVRECCRTKGKVSSRNDTTNQNGMDDTLQEVLSWVEMYISSEQTGETPKEASVTFRRKRKRGRRDSSSVGSNVICEDDVLKIGKDERNKALFSAKTATLILKSIVDSDSLKLLISVAMHTRCLEFAWICLRYMKTEIEKYSNVEKRSGKEWKEILSCVKSSLTYSAKIIYLCLKRSYDLAPQASLLANVIIDIIILIESAIGTRCALSVLALLKTWIPDLLISLSTSVHSLSSNDSLDDVNCKKNFDDLAEEGKLSSYAWCAALGTAEFGSLNIENSTENTANEDQNIGQCPKSGTEAAKKENICYAISDFARTLVKLVKKGDHRILQGFATMFLSQVAFLLKQNDYRKALGLLSFTCTKLLGCGEAHNQAQAVYLDKQLLQSLEEIARYVEKIVPSGECFSDDEQEHTIDVVRRLLDNVLSTQKT